MTEDVYADFFAETVRSAAAYLRGEPIRELTPTGEGEPAPRRYEDG